MINDHNKTKQSLPRTCLRTVMQNENKQPETYLSYSKREAQFLSYNFK